MRKLTLSFRAAQHGNVAIMFAFSLMPIMAAVGASVDFSVFNRVRTQLQAAADAAAVGSVAKASPAMAAVASMPSDGTITAGVTDALNIFNAQLTGKTGFTSVNPNVSVVKTGTSLISTVTYSATVPTVFMGLFGKSTLSATGSSTASNTMPMFADFYLLLDNTPSMGVGATPADINTMVNNTPDQCAFACHDTSTYPNDYYSKAKSLGVTMRIDVLRTATQQLMDTARATENYSNQFRMAIYTFGSSAKNQGLSTIQNLTSNLSTAKSAAAAIDLMTVPYQNYASDTDTDFNRVLGDINKTITSPGTGMTASSPQKFLFFVSDGVADRTTANGPCSRPTTNGQDPMTGTNYVRCQEPLDPSLCATIKTRGVKIAVLYTTYLPLPTNSWYNTWIAPFAGQISTNMKQCASPDLYFEVSPSQGISDAMKALFKKAVAQAHLTR